MPVWDKKRAAILRKHSAPSSDRRADFGWQVRSAGFDLYRPQSFRHGALLDVCTRSTDRCDSAKSSKNGAGSGNPRPHLTSSLAVRRARTASYFSMSARYFPATPRGRARTQSPSALPRSFLPPHRLCLGRRLHLRDLGGGGGEFQAAHGLVGGLRRGSRQDLQPIPGCAAAAPPRACPTRRLGPGG